MRHGRLLITMLAALAVMAIGPAYAAAATSSLVDDSAGDFGAGTLRPRHHDRQPRLGPADQPRSSRSTARRCRRTFNSFDPAGDGNRGGRPTRRRRRPRPRRPRTSRRPGQVLEFRAPSGPPRSSTSGLAGAGIAHHGPWAIFSTELRRRSLGAHPRRSGQRRRPISRHRPDPAPHVPHRVVRERRELLRRRRPCRWRSHTATIAGPMHAVVSDAAAGRRRRRHRLAGPRRLPADGHVRVARARHGRRDLHVRRAERGRRAPRRAPT